MPKTTMPVINRPKYQMVKDLLQIDEATGQQTSVSEYIEIGNEGRLIKAYRIRSLCDFVTTDGYQVRKGDDGGFVQHELNLSNSQFLSNKQPDVSWIGPLGVVIGTARVIGNAHYHGGIGLSEGSIVKSAQGHGHWPLGGSPLLITADRTLQQPDGTFRDSPSPRIPLARHLIL